MSIAMRNRYAKLKNVMEEKGLDAIYVNSPENHLYMCDFDNPDGALFITKDTTYVFADFRYIEAAKAEADPEFCTVCLPGQPKISEIVGERGIKVIGYEDEALTCFDFERFKESLSDFSVEYVPMGRTFTEIRAFKSEEEVAYITEAQRIAEAAFDHILKTITYDMTEIEVAAELEYFMKRNGSDKPSFDTVCVSGTASARPHGVPRHVKLEKGFLTMDYGAMVKGYHSDMTRTIVIGKADTEEKRLYNTVLEAQLTALDFVTEGVKNADCDKAARDIIDNAGYAGCFGHGLGHGVGLMIHELPNLSFRSGDATLKAGQLITVEPGIYLEGKYGCRIEDMVFITEGGKRNLTNCPKEMIEL